MIPEYLAPIANHLWQSTLFAAAVGLLTLALRNNRAAVRYALWLAASAKFLIPFSLFVAVGGLFEWRTATAIIPAAWPVAIDEVIAPPVFQVTASHAMASNASLLPMLILTVWALGFAAVMFSWWRAWQPGRAALRRATPLRLPAPALVASLDVRSSPDLLEPAVVGVHRPILLLPDGIADRLLPSELHAILAHELCHIRRRDNLAAMMHMLVEALFWFHPLVWWLEARLVDERERACDEEVLRSGNDPAVYAESILKICRFYVQSPLTCASGVSGANLKQRVEDILINRMTVRMNVAKKVLLATMAAAAVALPLATGFLAAPQAAAQAQTSADVPLSPEERAQKLAEQEGPRTAVPFDPKQFDRYVGFYQVGPYTFVRITRQGEHFIEGIGLRFFSLKNRPDDREIYPESPTKFFTTFVAGEMGTGGRTVSLQISFMTDSKGDATELILHQGGLEQHARKVDEAVVKAADAALAERIKDKTPSPGTEAMLRRYIAAFQKGQPNYEEMTPILATLVRGEVQGYLDYFQKWGALKSLTFDRVLDDGTDIYVAVFEHARVAMLIGPLTPDGKMATRGIHIFP